MGEFADQLQEQVGKPTDQRAELHDSILSIQRSMIEFAVLVNKSDQPEIIQDMAINLGGAIAALGEIVADLITEVRAK